MKDDSRQMPPPLQEDSRRQGSLLWPWAGGSPVTIWPGPIPRVARYGHDSFVSDNALWMAFPLLAPACSSLAEALHHSAITGVKRIFVLVGCEGGLNFGSIDCPIADGGSLEMGFDSRGTVNWRRGADVTVAAVRHAFAAAAQSYRNPNNPNSGNLHCGPDRSLSLLDESRLNHQFEQGWKFQHSRGSSNAGAKFFQS